ncbi:hypothetical protein AB0I54_47580 [Streptomyces sp. NPDC050625]|uniref:hypothetical protein n=1 Tax=Streptomyces sp. NPDC050625 TaxID=3154629 RepID=UPI00341B1F50
MPETAAAPLLVIGSHVSYHGSITAMHDRPLYLLPCTWFGRCAACWEHDDEFGERHPEQRDHFTAVDLTTDRRLHHAHRVHLTPIPHEWPEDAVPVNINDYRYAAAYTTPGGSHRDRTVHYYTAQDFMGRTWCHFREPAPDIRRLDQLGRRPVI